MAMTCTNTTVTLILHQSCWDTSPKTTWVNLLTDIGANACPLISTLHSKYDHLWPPKTRWCINLQSAPLTDDEDATESKLQFEKKHQHMEQKKEKCFCSQINQDINLSCYMSRLLWLLKLIKIHPETFNLIKIESNLTNKILKTFYSSH